MPTKTYRRKCTQCSGEGKFITKDLILGTDPRVETTTTQCSVCSGKGIRKLTQAQVNTEVRNKDYADKLKEKRAATRKQKAQKKSEFTDKWLSEVEDRQYIVDNVGLLGRFGSGLSAYFEKNGYLTPKQEEAARKSINLLITEEGISVPAGRNKVVGTVVRTIPSKNMMLIASDERYAVWGSIPTALRISGVKSGDRVEFWADTVVDESYQNTGRFIRPTKASRL